MRMVNLAALALLVTAAPLALAQQQGVQPRQAGGPHRVPGQATPSQPRARAAEAVTEALLAAPAGAYAPVQPGRTYVGAVSPAAMQAIGAVGEQAFQRWEGLDSNVTPAMARGAADPATWQGLVGVPLSEIEGVTLYGDAVHGRALWRLSAAATEQAMAALRARGFAPTERGWLSNGDPGAINIRARNPADPFRGMLGRSFAVRQTGPVLEQAVTYDPLPTPEQPLAPLAATAYATLRDAARDARFVQAIAFTPPLETSDPTVLLGDLSSGRVPSMDEVIARQRAEDERVAAAVRTAIPPTALAVLADLERPGVARGVVLVLTYGNCAAARLAGERFAGRWASMATYQRGGRTMTRPEATVRTAVDDRGGGICNAVAVVEAPPAPGDLSNPVFRYMIGLPGADASAPLTMGH